MTIKTVNYQKTFIIGPYQNEKIGFEAEIEGGNQTAEGCLSLLKEMAERWHLENNPHLQPKGPEFIMPPERTPSDVIDYKKWERFEIDIDNAETSDELELIIKQVDTFPGRLLSTINAKRQALKPKEFTDGISD